MFNEVKIRRIASGTCLTYGRTTVVWGLKCQIPPHASLLSVNCSGQGTMRMVSDLNIQKCQFTIRLGLKGELNRWVQMCLKGLNLVTWESSADVICLQKKKGEE